MSTVLAEKAVRFYDSTLGKKAVMALTGLILFGFLVVHMLGNLQVFIGAEQMDKYSATLHAVPELLWTARIILLISVVAHIWSWIGLAANNKAARPIGYQKASTVQASVGSRTMSLTGPVIAAFVIVHLLHLTTGTIHPGGFVELHAYENLVRGFTPPFALFYIIVMVLVGFHLSHGIWSMFQSVGFCHPRYTPMIKAFAAVFSWILIGGFIAVPVSVLLGIVR